jgi:hypothetical protein
VTVIIHMVEYLMVFHRFLGCHSFFLLFFFSSSDWITSIDLTSVLLIYLFLLLYFSTPEFLYDFLFMIPDLLVCLFWTQGFALAKHVLYHLSHTSSPFCSGYFGDGGLENYLLGLASILLISASEVDRIIGVSHRCPTRSFLSISTTLLE